MTAKQSGAVALPASQELVRGLRLADATMIVMGSMIGSGIFLVSADVARQLPSPALLLLTWLLGAAVTLICAVSYGELASALPYSGGQYVYLREGFGPLFGFLYGWTMFLVIQTGTIAAVAIGFAKYSGIYWPWLSSSHWLWHIGTFGPYAIGSGAIGPYDVGLTTQNLFAITSIFILTAVNCLGIRIGAWVQNIFTVTKTAALLALAVLGILIGRNAQAIHANFDNFWRNTDWSWGGLSLIAVAMVGPLFSADAWNNVTFTGEEVENPRRNLPLALVIGVGVVSFLYILTNITYLQVLPLEGSPNGQTVLERGIQYAAEDRVGTAAAQMIFGSAGLYLMAAAIMISTFGCNNGLILSGARVYFAMARDRLFFRPVAKVHPRYRTPVVSLIVQAVWASLLTLTGTYSQLLDYIMFAVLLFYILTLGALFVLRRRRARGGTAPEGAAPWWGFPWLPIIYFAIVGFIEIELLVHKPLYTWPGLVIVLLGVPVYLLWRPKSG